MVGDRYASTRGWFSFGVAFALGALAVLLRHSDWAVLLAVLAGAALLSFVVARISIALRGGTQAQDRVPTAAAELVVVDPGRRRIDVIAVLTRRTTLDLRAATSRSS